MAITTTLPPLPGSATRLSGELQDALVEALVVPPGPGARAAVICTLVQEMQSIVECLWDSETVGGCATEQELTSLRQFAAAADDHRQRMTFVMPLGKDSR
jgi:hypothetical protein